MRLIAAVGLSTLLAAGPAFADCGFRRAFHRQDKGGTFVVAVYQGPREAALGGERPLVFVSDLKVHTGGTQTSYHPNDPAGETIAIGRVTDLLRQGRTMGDFERVASAGWPSSQTWRVISQELVEREKWSGKPCLNDDGYLVARSSLGADPLALKRDGDCDLAKWVDGREIPSLVLPRGATGFSRRGAGPGSLAMAMTLDGPQRFGFGVVAHAGPSNEIGEASPAFNRQLNRLPSVAQPSDHAQAQSWFSVPRSVIMVFPGDANRVTYPLTAEGAEAQARARFEAWGGRERLFGCLAELGV